MNAEQRKDLSLLLTEYNSLSSKLKHTKPEEQRMAYLQVAISAVKSGVSLRELELENLNETERRNGLPLTNLNASFLSRERQAEARGWQGFVETGGVEQRDMTVGNPISHIGTYTGLGFFVPNDFFTKVFATMKQHDRLFDE